jgi:hypothetical protein
LQRAAERELIKNIKQRKVVFLVGVYQLEPTVSDDKLLQQHLAAHLDTCFPAQRTIASLNYPQP